MSDQEDEAESSSQSTALERMAEGGLLRLLVSKPVQQAIGRLVNGAVDVPLAALEIPSAWLRRVSQGIKDDADARSQLTKAVLVRAKKEAAVDEDLTAIALRRWSSNITAKHKNAERVAFKAVKFLSEAEVPPEAAAPDEDFMGLFSDIAENAFSEGLSDLLGRILAGEIRKPVSVSRRTLQVVQALDQKAIQALMDILPYLSSSGLIYIPEQIHASWLKDLHHLSSLGIVTEVGIRQLSVNEEGVGVLVYGDRAVIYHRLPAPAPQSFPSMQVPLMVDSVNMTPAGLELAAALPGALDKPDLLVLATSIQKIKQIAHVGIGTCAVVGGAYSITDVRAMPEHG